MLASSLYRRSWRRNAATFEYNSVSPSSSSIKDNATRSCFLFTAKVSSFASSLPSLSVLPSSFGVVVGVSAKISATRCTRSRTFCRRNSRSFSFSTSNPDCLSSPFSFSFSSSSRKVLFLFLLIFWPPVAENGEEEEEAADIFFSSASLEKIFVESATLPSCCWLFFSSSSSPSSFPSSNDEDNDEDVDINTDDGLFFPRSCLHNTDALLVAFSFPSFTSSSSFSAILSGEILLIVIVFGVVSKGGSVSFPFSSSFDDFLAPTLLSVRQRRLFSAADRSQSSSLVIISSHVSIPNLENVTPQSSFSSNSVHKVLSGLSGRR